MRILFRVILLVLMTAFQASFLTGYSFAQVLLQQSHLIYEGAFRVPTGKLGAQQSVGFAYGGAAIGYNPANNSLFIVGHVYDQMTAEIGIPEIINSSNLSNLRTAPVLQQFSDAFEGQMDAVDPGEVNGFRLGGHLVYGNQLYLSDYTYYDADSTQVTSHFGRPPNLSATGQLNGPYQVGNAGAGFVSGYMTQIPAEWQASFGGPALTGNCCIAIISRSSLGPAVSVFDPEDLGVQNPVPATEVLGYPIDHPTLGTWDGEELQIRFTIWPHKSRVLCFLKGRQRFFSSEARVWVSLVTGQEASAMTLSIVIKAAMHIPTAIMPGLMMRMIY